MADTISTLLQSLHLEHLPPGYTLHATLFTSVSNATFLHQQLLAGNSDFEYAFIDAAVISSRTHVLAAAFRAINDLIEGRLKSRNVHSEMVFCLNINNNIATSFRTFGLTPATKHVIILKLSTPSAPVSSVAIQSHIAASVQGQQVSFSDDTIAKFTDWPRIEKAYKLVGSGGGKKIRRPKGVEETGNDVSVNGKKSTARQREDMKEMEIRVLGVMALRGVS